MADDPENLNSEHEQAMLGRAEKDETKLGRSNLEQKLVVMPTAFQTQSHLAVGFEQAFGEVFALSDPNATDQAEPIRNRILARMSLHPAYQVHTHETMLSHQWNRTSISQ
jgi:hypothetical protein